MERKRKGYLLRKSDPFEQQKSKFNTNGNAVCLCNKSLTRSYDLQTQTVTFEEEVKPKRDKRKIFPCSSILQTFNEDSHRVPSISPEMDQDLEFYPVDDHPSPSTFTAWDAFLAGNQAFFREPPCLLPDPAFSYMDVIPEEDDLEALMESDTDDTGSSVSTVIDRFSRTSTANSSFSERCKGSTEVTFDLQKVLGPFERLEKELDAVAPKDDEDMLHKKEIQRGPIVVITNSSSCEDVNSAGEEEGPGNSEVKVENELQDDAKISAQSTEQSVLPDEDVTFSANESSFVQKDVSTTEILIACNETSSQQIKSDAMPSVPSRSKLVNGCKNGEKSSKKSKLDKATPSSSPSSPKKKKSYPTPTVPPRMSKHLPARRTRSDPGSADQPSRIPRPISNTNRSPSTSTPKSTPKSSRSPKLNSPKKLKIAGSPKSTRTAPSCKEKDVALEDVTAHETPPEDKLQKQVEEQLPEDSRSFIDEEHNVIIKCPDDVHSAQSNNSVEISNSTVVSVDATSIYVNGYSNDEIAINNEEQNFPFKGSGNDETEAASNKNPFRRSETNPFRNDVECKNPFVKRNNPFDNGQETTPALQPKGQMSTSLIAPPIPERPSLKSAPLATTSAKRKEDSCPSVSNSKPASPDCSQETTVDGKLVVAPNDVIDPAVCTLSSVRHPVLAPELPDEACNEYPPRPPQRSCNIPPQFDALEAFFDKGQLDESKIDSESLLTMLLDGNDDKAREVPAEAPKELDAPQQQRPIEDILQALDQLVLSAPREVEINIDWGARGPVNIREKTVVPSTASGDGSTVSEMDGLTEDRRRDIETLLREVDECLRMHQVCEDSNAQQTTEDSPLPASDLLLPVSERTPLGPGTPDAPTAGSATVTLRHHDVRESGAIATDELPGHTSSAMLRHQPQGLLAEEQRVLYSAYQEAYNKSTEQLEEDPLVNKNHSPGCDDSGVFLEEPIASSPETQPKSAAARLQNRLEKLSNESSKMRQYSIHEGLDSDAEKSDDLGLASSSIDSADDLDGDPLPSTLQIVSCPPVVPTRQKPPPVPARKCVTTSSDSQKNNRYYINEISTLEVPNQMKTPLSKSSSSGEDSNFGEGDHCINENSPTNVIISENSKNIINQQKNDQYRSSFAMTRSFHEEVLMNQQRELNPSQDSKSNFLARTLSSSSSARKLDISNGSLGGYARRNSEQPSGFKWKSEECLRTAAESKWSLPGRRYEKSVSVKDRIAMFSEMEANQSTTKRDDLQRYGSENNIKAVAVSTDSKKVDMPPVDGNKNGSLLRDSKWHSMHSINKKYVEKEVPYGSSNLKPAMSIPSLAPNTESIPGNNYSILPVKLEVDPPKPIVSTYPETQLTNNKRYNYGLYSLKNLKNTEDLLSKKAAGSTLLSIIDSRKQPLQKLKGLVIPDKPYLSNNGKELPTIVSSDSDGLKESRRASLPVTVVTPCKTMSLPRNKKLECPPPQRQTSLSEPPWKNESNRSSNTLPKYSPAFKKRSLELPGSSLSPTPPSSITSPLSPPPSSPSSICSSNASSTLQQNVFQFSLTHSKPVQPLQPEKALMSPPSLPSDVEYEGDNSEDSSHSASPMRNSIRGSQDSKTSSLLNPGVVHYGKSNTFTSCARTVSHQPLKVETIMKASSVSESEQSKPKAAVYLSRTEISLKKEEQKRIESPQLDSSSTTRDPEFIENDITSNERTLSPQIYTSGKINNFLRNEMTSASNGISDDYFSKSQNGVSQNYMIAKAQECPFDVSVGKFHALPLSLKESEAKQTPYEKKLNKNGDCGLWTNGRPANSECEESDDDSHSTLSHRTEDSRHTTTDECLSDATTDSFEKPRLVPEPSHLQRATEDYASTEGYLSDASTTDVSLRRFTNRPLDSNAYSTEEYFSDATAESPDPDWISNRGSVVVDSHTRSYVKVQTSAHSSVHQRDTEGTDPSEKNVDPDLRPRRLSQQRTVLKAATQPSGSVQKFKALAEKWEQRSDVISPPPPPVVAVGQKKESRSGSISTTVVSSSVSSTVIKGKSTLPPSLMPRNSSSEKKSVSPSKQSSKDSMYASRTVTEREFTSSTDAVGTRRSSTTTTVTTETTTNGWNHHPYEEVCRVEPTTRRDSTSSSSSSSKTTLKEDEAFDSSPNHVDANNFELSKQEVVTSPSPSMNNKNDIGSSQSGLRSSSSSTRPCEETWNNEPRNRRGADFSRTSSVTDWPKATNRPSFGSKATFSVSDIRRSFENGSREPEKPSVAKMPPMPAARNSTPAAPPPVTSKTVRRQSSSIDVIEEDEELRRLMDGARNQLFQEGVGNQLHVLAVVLHREGEGGGSVGITLAGGADYEVKEITVHKVIGGSIADRDGRVLKGDRVMSINGRDLRGVSHGEALHILKAPSPRVLLVLARDKNGISIQMNGTEKETKRVQDYDINRDSETFVVELQKDAAGLGFSIEGGRDSPQGDRPLLIKRIFKGGAADKDGQLEEGDEILAVNEHPVSNMTRTEAWNFLKKLPEGPVVIKARKTLLR